MHLLKYIIFGFIGGGIGAAIWIFVGYASGYEVGYIAWGVGFLAGMGVRVAADENEGAMPGVIAAATALTCVLFAKFMVITLLVANATGDIREMVSGFEIDTETMISEEADAIIEEQEAAGKTVEMPPEIEDAPLSQSYPPRIWADATKRWESLPAEQQQAKIKEQEEAVEAFAESMQAAIGDQMRSEAFSESFSPWDLLWFGLAAFTAFRIGSGAAGDDDD